MRQGQGASFRRRKSGSSGGVGKVRAASAKTAGRPDGDRRRASPPEGEGVEGRREHAPGPPRLGFVGAGGMGARGSGTIVDSVRAAVVKKP